MAGTSPLLFSFIGSLFFIVLQVLQLARIWTINSLTILCIIIIHCTKEIHSKRKKKMKEDKLKRNCIRNKI